MEEVKKLSESIPWDKESYLKKDRSKPENDLSRQVATISDYTNPVDTSRYANPADTSIPSNWEWIWGLRFTFGKMLREGRMHPSSAMENDHTENGQTS